MSIFSHQSFFGIFVYAFLDVNDAHIQNSLEVVKYIDGVSSNEDSEEDDIKEKESKENAEKIYSSEEIDTFRVIGLRRKAGESLVIKVDIWKYEGCKIVKANFVRQMYHISSLVIL